MIFDHFNGFCTDTLISSLSKIQLNCPYYEFINHSYLQTWCHQKSVLIIKDLSHYLPKSQLPLAENNKSLSCIYNLSSNNVSISIHFKLCLRPVSKCATLINITTVTYFKLAIQTGMYMCIFISVLCFQICPSACSHCAKVFAKSRFQYSSC